MSVFIGQTPDEGTHNRKARKKYFTKYNAKYQEEYPWAMPSSKGDLYAFCQLCRVDICIRSVGAKGLRDHEATCRHSQKVHQMGLKSAVPLLNTSSTQQHFSRENFSPVGPGGPREPSFPHEEQGKGLPPATEDMASITIEPFPHPSNTSSVGHQQAINAQVLNNSLQEASSCNLSNSVYPMLEVGDSGRPPPYSSSAPQYYQPAQFNPQQLPSLILKNDGNDQIDLLLGGGADVSRKRMPSAVASSNSAWPVIGSQKSNSGMRNSREAKRSSNQEDGAVDQSTMLQTKGSSEWTFDEESRNREPLSVEDLTCNICGEIFLDWKELKKDLLAHVKDAQKSKSTSHNQEEASVKRKEKRSQMKIKKSPATVNNGALLKRKRGRPPGSKKRTLQEQQPQSQQEAPDFASLCDSSSGSSDFGNSTIASSELSATLTKKVKRKRGRPPKVKMTSAPPASASLLSNDSFVCAPADEEYWVETFELNAHSSVTLEECNQKTGVMATPSAQLPSRRSGHLQCRVCKGLFYLRQELREHYRNEHNNGRPYECELCHKYFTTKNHLTVHKKHKHINGPDPCMCTVCAKTLSSRTNLKIHMMIHKGDRPYSCPVCKKQFGRKANMEMHIVYHTGERKFTCEVCGQGFFAISALKRHKKLHTGEREYSCDVCGASYVTRTDLRRHLLKHDDVKPFPCSRCEKQFTRSHDLKVHMRYHNKELRFTCNICGNQFVESGNYRRHMRRHTGERPYTCKVCQQTFSQVHHYKVHMKTNHQEQNEGRAECVQETGKVPSKVIQHNQKGKGVNVASSSPVILPYQPGTIIATVGFVNSSMGSHIQGASSSSVIPCATTQITPIGNPMSPSYSSLPSTIVTPSVTHTSTNSNPTAVSIANAQAQITQAGVGPPTSSGFLQYNSYVYNGGSVIPQYHTLFDMYPQQNSGNAVGTQP